ncbi:MAG: hypothetical protein JWM57_3378 [Phycisphaerales bacterium]|nr:hypothetical protein [Phycisphaerales bacterium]
MQQGKPAPTTVYLLEHEHEMPAGHDDVKLLGIYSSQAKAERARERLRLQPGFREWPNGFIISSHQVDQDELTEGFVTLMPEDM